MLSLVPSFPAYARVFHPAYRFDRASEQPWETRTPVRWDEIATASSTQAHAGMQLCGLTGSYRSLHEAQPGVYDHQPSEGSLPSDLARALVAVLTRHTETPQRCWFAVWYGFGDTRDDVRQAPTFHVPARDYFLLQGPIDAAPESAVESRERSANLWWPDDRAWCVATEIDLNTTYIGCAEPCRDEIVGLPQLEALPIDPATGISRASDLLNPKPE